jgi:hypothetical protein
VPAVLRLRGVPFAANESNIMQFFGQAEDIQQPIEVYICRRNGEGPADGVPLQRLVVKRLALFDQPLAAESRTGARPLAAAVTPLAPPLDLLPGRSTGECYVVLPSAADAASARQQLDKRHIGHRYIE